MGLSSSYVFAALVLAVTVICHGKPPQSEDIGTNFFLKASKSVPRIGRRTMEYDNYFLKASKSIPRIGRRTLTSSTQADEGWFPRDTEEPIKRSFFEKYFKESEYPGAVQGDESYPGGAVNPKLDWNQPRTKKNEEEEEEVVQEQPENEDK